MTSMRGQRTMPRLLSKKKILSPQVAAAVQSGNVVELNRLMTDSSNAKNINAFNDQGLFTQKLCFLFGRFLRCLAHDYLGMGLLHVATLTGHTAMVQAVLFF
jgi:hypothetical protein